MITPPTTSINELVCIVAIVYVVIWAIIMVALKIKHDKKN